MDERSKTYWQTFQETLPVGSPYRDRAFTADRWGDGPELATELGDLIAAGVKTATCSSVWVWQSEGQDWTQPGEMTVVLNGRDEPLCIIETTEITIRRYDEVDASFAFDEGEGDRSLEYWRAAHLAFFSRNLQKINRQFAEDMPLVCERFKLIYP
jgi:uncharacterized protein YhfF